MSLSRSDSLIGEPRSLTNIDLFLCSSCLYITALTLPDNSSNGILLSLLSTVKNVLLAPSILKSCTPEILPPDKETLKLSSLRFVTGDKVYFTFKPLTIIIG